MGNSATGFGVWADSGIAKTVSWSELAEALGLSVKADAQPPGLVRWAAWDAVQKHVASHGAVTATLDGRKVEVLPQDFPWEREYEGGRRAPLKEFIWAARPWLGPLTVPQSAIGRMTLSLAPRPAQAGAREWWRFWCERLQKVPMADDWVGLERWRGNPVERQWMRTARRSSMAEVRAALPAAMAAPALRNLRVAHAKWEVVGCSARRNRDVIPRGSDYRIRCADGLLTFRIKDGRIVDVESRPDA